MNMLYLTLLFPLLGFLILSYSNNDWSENVTATIGVGSIGLSALTTICIIMHFFDASSKDITVFTNILYNWINVGDFHIPITLSIDGLSLIMLSIVTIVGFFIHLYASWYMEGEKEYSRFFAYTNIFIFSMIILVLADNILLMYIGWECVGFCSYLLIGFYYKELKNSTAAIKYFITTKVGDILLLVALFILYYEFKTLNFNEIMMMAPKKLVDNHKLITEITLMILCGAIGKSAQIPLQTWLSDAMVAPTPVSALIHAATMVTLGVYLIARTHILFLMSPVVLKLVGIIGAITLILASLTALVQTDIKKILAYSTISQIGYMFLALGVKAWYAAIFHLMIHAFFKALLFLSSGSISLMCFNERNIFKMGVSYKSVPLIYICFLVGGSALSGLPLISAGFYSKDAIIYEALYNGHIILALIGLIGIFLTAMYTFRMIFIIFHGKENMIVNYSSSIRHYLPLVVLLILSSFFGSLITLPLSGVFNYSIYTIYDKKIILQIISSLISIIGIFLAAFLWLSNSDMLKKISNSVFVHYFTLFSCYSWGFDWLYDKIFIKPYLFITSLIINDPLSIIIECPIKITINGVKRYIICSENGQLRWYVALMSLGLLIIMIMFLIFR